jgi:hypothetical protein
MINWLNDDQVIDYSFRDFDYNYGCRYDVNHIISIGFSVMVFIIMTNEVE